MAVTVRARFSGNPAGTVTVTASAKTICVIHLRVGHGSCAPAATKLRPGSYRLIAAYSGSTGFLRSTSAGTNLTVRTAWVLLARNRLPLDPPRTLQ